MYQMEHKRGGRYPTMTAVRSIMERFGKVSVLDGSTEDLCVVRFFLDECPWNGLLVTSRQARHLPRERERRLQQFPAALQEEMKKQQQHQ
jgi:hypothetical protein